MRTRLTMSLALASMLALGACGDSASVVSPEAASDDGLESLATVTALSASSIWEGGYGAVFTTSNSPEGNEVLTFYRAPDGTLYPKEPVSTGGLGTGGGLGNQGALTFNGDRSLLLVVNAGSDDISVMGTEGWPELLHRVPSRGTRPISVAVRGSLVYVLNGGGEENVAGFRLSRKGRLTPIPGAVYPLSEAQVGSAQVGFSPDGRSLVVTEKATNRILVFPVLRNGRLGEVRVEQSAGQTPFGFAFNRQGTLVVSEAFGGAPGASVLSSYGIQGGDLVEITPWPPRPRRRPAGWSSPGTDGSPTPPIRPAAPSPASRCPPPVSSSSWRPWRPGCRGTAPSTWPSPPTAGSSTS